ncbi:MAG: hypothetical protein EBX41_04055 [Chitinophagia bacterium]|nr:hypothetical protein [Chitinophagia bacterium]
MNKEQKLLAWILRIGVCGTFIGHGTYALQVKPTWIKLITSLGFTPGFAVTAMPVIGIVDYIVAILALLKPNKYLFMWAALWCTLTAFSRITAGESVLELLERFSNIACPLALVYLYSNRK